MQSVISLAAPAVPESSNMRSALDMHHEASVVDSITPGLSMKTVLILDDDPANLQIFVVILRSKGYSVLEANTGREALDAAQRQQDPVNLLTCDVGLKGDDFSGTEAAVALANGRDDFPVLFVSGNPVTNWDAGDRQNFNILNQKLVTVLEKPFLPSALENAVELLLQKSDEPTTQVVASRSPFGRGASGA